MAIHGAQEIAHQRGEFVDKAGMLAFHYDCILFRERSTVFVRVKRIRAHISNPQEIARLFNEAILQLRRVPKTAGVSREMWVLSPGKTWQYFQILDDRIVENKNRGNSMSILRDCSVYPKTSFPVSSARP